MSELKFAVMSHFDYKEDCGRIIFLQYNGNEENIKNLANVINNNHQDGSIGDSCKSSIDIEHFVNEQTVDEMCKINTRGYYNSPLKLYGRMKPIIFNINEYMTEDDIMSEIDDKLYKCKIKNYFEYNSNNY